MQSQKLTLAVCENFLPETKAVLAQNKLPDVNLVSWKPCCEHPPKSWDEISNLFDVQDKTPLLIVGACFPRGLQKPPESLDHMHIHHLEQCFHLLYGKVQVEALIKDGCYLISPAWLANWQRHLEQWGFDHEHAQIFFKDTSKKIVLLDTGTLDNAFSEVEKFADYVGLPYTKIDIGLDFITQYLRTLILEWENNSLKTSLASRRDQAANYAMALTLLDELTDKDSEDEVVKGVIELFKTLFAPEHINFFSDEGNNHDQEKQATLKQELSNDCRRKLNSETYLLHESGDGFSLSLQTQELRIGCLDIAQIAFPEHIQRYLNLAITIAPLCALAINKANISESIRAQNKQLEYTNQLLKESDVRLSESEDRYRSLYNNAPLPYQSLDEEGCIIDINPAWLQTLGYQREEVIGQWYGDFLHPDWKSHYEENFLVFKQRGYVNDVQFKIKHKDDYDLDISFDGCIGYTPEGEFKQTYCVFQDITEQKRAEEQRNELEDQLRQKHKMEAVGYMAGGMAHNFNNNLGIILGNVELSQLKIHDPMVQGLLKNAKIAILRSRDLVGQIITYSRKGIQNKAPMKLLTIVDETITLLGSTLPSTINLQMSVSPACESAFIHADASQMQEILINLCNNAIQAMNEKGDLTISLESVELTQTEISAQYDGTPGSYAKLSVQDTGCGMPAEMLDKIFDPFYTTKEDYEGAGMGLATVQGIVAQHGGVIKVNSIPNQGTVFNLYFPLVDEISTEAIPINGDMPKGTEKILFVDDDEQLATLGEKLLSEMGYQVVIMTESSEALKLFTANPDHFDMVITDQTMPFLTGKELIQELKKIRPDLHTILCTGYSSQIDEDQAKQQGIDAFCMKPLDLPELLQTVRRVLDGEEE